MSEDCGAARVPGLLAGSPGVNPVCGVHVSVARAVQPHGRAEADHEDTFEGQDPEDIHMDHVPVHGGIPTACLRTGTKCKGTILSKVYAP